MNRLSLAAVVWVWMTTLGFAGEAAEPATRAGLPLADLIGSAEQLRAEGKPAEALGRLKDGVSKRSSKDEAAELAALVVWRSLPVSGAGRAALESLVKRDLAAGHESRPGAAWGSVYRLYFAGLAGERPALVDAAKTLRLPEVFPTAAADAAAHRWLIQQGVERSEAGLRVISQRSFEPLFALRDLDLLLTREADYFKASGDAGAAGTLTSARDQLREAYLKAARHAVEKLFALSLLGRTQERQQLLGALNSREYLHNPEQLRSALARLGPEDGWELLIRPLLSSDLAVILAPPTIPDSLPKTAALTVESPGSAVRGAGGATYRDARVQIRGFQIQAGTLSIPEGQGQAVRVRGSGKVIISGHPAFPQGIEADEMTLESATLQLQLRGHVRLRGVSRESYWRACSVALDGEISGQESPDAELKVAKSISEKLAAVKAMRAWLPESALPEEARYLLALDLLRPLLSWHAGFSNVEPNPVRMLQDVRAIGGNENSSPWREAHGGEDWMRADIPPSVKAQAKLRVEQPTPEGQLARAEHSPQASTAFFWLLKDPQAAGVGACVRLLESLPAESAFHERAERWLADLRRNNTVLTFDVPGVFTPNQDARLMLDARLAERVSLRLYPVRAAEDLAAVCARIGEDFTFREYGSEHLAKLAQVQNALEAVRKLPRREPHPEPAFLRAEALATWEIRPSELPIISAARMEAEDFLEDEDEGDEEPDSEYFNDRCSQFGERLARAYDREAGANPDELSSWQVAREVQVPARLLSQPGAYVLVAEANGQRAFAPLLVDPLQVLARRCRDGIFVLASSPDGKLPVAGATVAGTAPILNPGETTDPSGAAFVKMFGGGDRALIVAHDGRYAIAGFGRVFAGLFGLDRSEPQRMRVIQRAVADLPEQVAHVYESRLVAAALTDRPTYRPGQRVQAKVILRELGGGEERAGLLQPKPEAAPHRFREGDFDLGFRLGLLPVGSELPYEILDPQGRVVAQGALTTNDFGTATLAFDLNTESRTGRYSVRLTHRGTNHVLPEVFQVLYYRRPNFEVALKGVPAQVPTAPQPFVFSVAAHYYFGRPVGAGAARMRLVRPGEWQPVVEATLALDSNGQADFSVDLPTGLEAGNLILIAEVSDASGRTVVVSQPVSGFAGKPGERLLSKLPRFLAVGGTIAAGSARYTIQRLAEGENPNPASSVENGELTFRESGWYEVSAGGEKTRIFAYPREGDMKSFEPQPTGQIRESADPEKAGEGWINLGNYRDPFGFEGASSRFSPGHAVWALFEGHHVSAGSSLRVLLRVPTAPCRVVLTVEGRTVVDYHVVEMTTAFQVVELPVTERWLPNVYLQACVANASKQPEAEAEKLVSLAEAGAVLEGEDDGSEDPRWCRVDVINPDSRNPRRVRHPQGEALNVTVTTDRPEYRPGEAVRVNLAVTGKDGQPREAEVALAAVDESLFTFGEGRETLIAAQMTGTQPERRFLDKAWRQVGGARPLQLARAERLLKAAQDLAQAQAALATQNELAAAVPEISRSLADAPRYQSSDVLPSGEIPVPRLRQDFRETAAWLPQLRTNPDGRVSATFTLPDSLTRYRLTALGLTRATEIGSGRTSLRAILPLSAQVFLPRFAVEGDRLTAVGLIHSTASEPRTVNLTWRVRGAEIVNLPEGWTLEEKAGDQVVSARVLAPAAGSARVALPLEMRKTGMVELELTVAAGSDADAERRTLEVKPWGRAREIVHRAAVKAQAGNPGAAAFTLPEGFVLDALQVSLSRQSRIEVADSLEGLRYLISYPYGCVEQTMSRLMPAIVARDATRQSQFALPPDLAARLPEVIDRGLARLYNFQHGDGGWGWWEKDATNDRMSVYVLYGLARCSRAGVSVDQPSLSRGLKWLQERLAANRLEPTLIARGWLVLAIAGAADRAALEKAAGQMLLDARAGLDPLTEMALACLQAGSPNLANSLWQRVRIDPATRAGSPLGVASLALRLTAQFEFRDSLENCYATAKSLTALRQGYLFGSTWGGIL